MNGKIRVSIVATSLNGSTIHQEPRPIFNIVGGSNKRNKIIPKIFFLKNNIEQNILKFN